MSNETAQKIKLRWGIAEVLVAFGCLSVAAAVGLPQLLQWRETNRCNACQKNLQQIGIALDAYHLSNRSYPPGYSPGDYHTDGDGVASWRYDMPSFAWSAFLLPYLESTELHQQLDVGSGNLLAVVNDPLRHSSLRTVIPSYCCGSDQLGEAMDSAPLPPYHRALDRGHGTVFGGAGSYVGNGGYFELNHPLLLAPPQQWIRQIEAQSGPNNGVFHVASKLHRRQIVDGLAQTIAVGERAWYQGGASWVGTANVCGVAVGDTGVSLGRFWWKINEVPHSALPSSAAHRPVVVTKKNGLLIGASYTSRDGFGSYHPDGANFLMCDGSVRFISDDIEFRNTIPVNGANPMEPIPSSDQLGLFQKLGIRNDSLAIAVKTTSEP